MPHVQPFNDFPQARHRAPPRAPQCHAPAHRPPQIVNFLCSVKQIALNDTAPPHELSFRIMTEGAPSGVNPAFGSKFLAGVLPVFCRKLSILERPAATLLWSGLFHCIPDSSARAFSRSSGVAV